MHPDITRRLRKLPILSCCLLAISAPAAEPASDEVVAKIGRESIPYAKLQESIQEALVKQENEHERQLQQLNLSFVRTQHEYIESELGKLVDKRVLELEAGSRKTTPAALTAAIVTPPVTDAQVRSFYESRAAQISQPLAQIEPKIKQFLQNQGEEQSRRKYLDSLRGKYKAFTTMEPLREQVDVSGPQRGLAGAPVTIVEFSDFECPYCRQFTPVLAQLLAAYPSQVRLVYRHFPLTTLHPEAQKASEAAVCANNQGKFWELHDTLFAEQNSMGVKALKEKANRLGLDAKQFEDCLDSGAATAAVAADVAAGERLGIGATPATFVNGRFVNGAVTLEQMTALIDDELHRAPAMALR